MRKSPPGGKIEFSKPGPDEPELKREYFWKFSWVEHETRALSLAGSNSVIYGCRFLIPLILSAQTIASI